MIAIFIALLCPHICIVAPHIGTLAETYKGNGVGAKPEDGVWWIHPEDRRIRQVLDWRMLARRVSSDIL
jgi:hypothetical protein